jgi:hypothetical protein
VSVFEVPVYWLYRDTATSIGSHSFWGGEPGMHQPDGIWLIGCLGTAGASGGRFEPLPIRGCDQPVRAWNSQIVLLQVAGVGEQQLDLLS